MKYFINSYIILTNFCLFVNVIIADKINLCGDWIPYKEEKCFKILEKVGTQQEAIRNCTQLESNSTLITIHSLVEQNFISNLLIDFNHITENVWIGLTNEIVNPLPTTTTPCSWCPTPPSTIPTTAPTTLRTTPNPYSTTNPSINKPYIWKDNTELSYTNWSEGSPSNDPCVEMSITKPSLGKWTDITCGKRALIVCQKRQEWTITVLSNLFIKMNDLVNTLQNTTNKLENMSNNPIPVGFIYVQLPNQTNPQLLWPEFFWKNVSQEYEGLFFRVMEGDADDFGRIQEDNAPRLTTVEMSNASRSQIYTNTIKRGENSSWFITGSNDGSQFISMKFGVSGGEVRPRNTAIAVWKRVQ